MNFGRVVKLYVNGFTIEKLRINFSIEYRKAATPAEGACRGLQLDAAVADAHRHCGRPVPHPGGARGGARSTRLGDGDVRRVSHSVMPPDVVTRIYFGGNVEDRQNAVWVQAFPRLGAHAVHRRGCGTAPTTGWCSGTSAPSPRTRGRRTSPRRVRQTHELTRLLGAPRLLLLRGQGGGQCRGTRRGGFRGVGDYQRVIGYDRLSRAY